LTFAPSFLYNCHNTDTQRLLRTQIKEAKMEDQVGQRLGNYQLIRLIGSGGFAQVYLAEHVYLGTQAAIKVLDMQLTGNTVEWFLSEARTIARLVHPHIVRVLEFGVEDQIPFLVLDYAPHGSLRQLHADGPPFPLSTIITYVKQVAEALQYAHDEKLIHRDVKPENMLLGRRNEVLLSDFGLALIAKSTQFQSLQNVAGTLAYMAPEQMQGKPRQASDQYALGVVVYEWLTGDVPFTGSFTEVLSQHLAATPPSLREKIPTVSPAIEQVVMRALEKDPNERFARVEEFAAALEQASLSQALSSQQASTPRVLPIDGPLASPGLPTQIRSKDPVESVSARPPANAAPGEQTAQVGTLRCSYRGHQTAVHSLSWSPDGTRILSTGDEKIVHVWNATTGSTISLYQDAADAVRVVAWSSDGSLIATAGADAFIRVWDVVTNRLLITYRGHGGDSINAMAWSPQQHLLASAGNDGLIHVWDATTGQPITIYRGHAGGILSLAWSFDGRNIVSGGADSSVQVWQALTGRNLSTYRGQIGKVVSTAWSPIVPPSPSGIDPPADVRNGSRIACGREDGTVQMWDMSMDREVLTYRYAAPIQVMAWSPNGRRFAYASADKTVQVWDTITNQKLFTFHHSAPVQVMAWSPNGTFIASGGGDAIIQVWVVP